LCRVLYANRRFVLEFYAEHSHTFSVLEPHIGTSIVDPDPQPKLFAGFGSLSRGVDSDPDLTLDLNLIKNHQKISNLIF
jgi:hypothetical protein